MVLDIILPIFTEIIKDPIYKYVIVPVKRHISYTFKSESKVTRLQDEAERLKNKRERLQQSIDQATRNGEEIFENVTKWLTSADQTIKEADELIQGKEQVKKWCSIGLCPNLQTRHMLGRNSEKKTLAIYKLLNEGELDSISYLPPPKQIAAESVYSREALHSRVSILKEIMDALKDPNLNMIGVYGMGGVGKTTLAKEVHRQAQDDKSFDVVVMVSVSQTPDVRRIQEEIAEVLGLDLREEGMLLRANRLCERLKKEKKVLIILDDIWKQLDLKAVGIPFGDDCRGCSILLTSRRRDVLSREMGTQKEFRLEVLQEKEAWSLFEMTVVDAEDPKLPPIATEIVKKCAGLPLLIHKVAMDLRRCESYKWNDKLKQLSDFDNEEIEEKVHSVLKSSYNNLPPELGSFFLLCGLFGESNIQIQSLLKYSMGLGLFKRVVTVEDMRNKVFTLIDDLKAECLLLDGDMDGFVKMHDVVRDTALSIASRKHHAFIGINGTFPMELPNKDCTTISLPYCDIQELPQWMECPKAELLSLFTEDLSLEVPDLFFEGIRKLKVVDFTGMRFISLPSSIGFLINLHTLCLHRCQMNDVVVIKELKQLGVLSFADSYIVELPRQIEELTQLKLLDLGNCSKLKVIPANVLSKLSLLEALYMNNSFVQWDVKGISNEGNASLTELEQLSRLTTLEIQVLDAKIIPKTLFSHGLRRYKIFIGDVWGWHGNYETSKTLKLKLKTSIHLEYGVKELLRDTEDLYLDEVSGVENILYDIDREGFPRLKHLHVQNDVVIQHVINSTKWAACHAFPILESLFLENLLNLEEICHGKLEAGSFSKLRILEVRNCERLTNLFLLPTKIEAPVIDESENNNEVVEFGQLCSLKLINLPHLQFFCGEMKVALGTEVRRKQSAPIPEFEEFVSEHELGAHSSLFNRMVSFPNLEDLQLTSINCENIWHDHLSTTSSNLTCLILNGCHNLKYLFTVHIVSSLLQLKKLEIENCKSIEEIILTEVAERKESVTKILFPNLDKLRLYLLPKLVRFCNGCPVEFQSLRELDISYCDVLMCFVPSVPLAGMIAKEGKTKMNDNPKFQSLFDEMVAFSNLETLKLHEMSKLKSIWHDQLTANSFCKLKSLRISECRNLVTVFSWNVLERFKRLEELQLDFCASLQEIYHLEGFNIEEGNVIAAFELRDLSLCWLESLKHVWSKDPQGLFTFENLKSVRVDGCKVLKNLLPTSIAKGLLQLEQLEINDCGVEEIVAKAEGVELTPYFFKFPRLTYLELSKLPKLRSFYPGTHTCEWQKLRCLKVYDCRRVVKFASEFSAYQQGDGKDQHNIPIQPPFFLLEKVSPKLEELTLESEDLTAIQLGQLPFDCFSKLKVLTLSGLQNEARPFLLSFLKRHCYLEKVHAFGGNLEELFSHGGFVGEEEHAKPLARVKHLELSNVDSLKCIWKQDPQVEPLLQYLQSLRVDNCKDLINIAPSSSSFLNLATVHVVHCDGLTHLIMASTAKTMVQLTNMRISYCPSLTEIVSSDGDHMEDEIIFSKLKYLELEYLTSLTSFFAGNHALSFPSLENVIVTGCYKMKIFSHGILITPKLRGILVKRDADKQHWEGDLNATIASQLTERVGSFFQVSEFPELWHNGNQGRLFLNVESLVVDKHALSSKAISANLLQFLSKLRKIEVRDCDSLEVVFDMEGLSTDDGQVGLLPRLSELKLKNLSMLKHLWNKDPGEILDLKNLRLLQVQNCGSLEYIFTKSMAFCLRQLQKIEILKCNMLEGIIGVEAEESTSENKMIFPSLESVVLQCLPKFSSFCLGSSNMEYPLKKMSIYDCPSMKTFFSTPGRAQKPGKDDEGREHRLDKMFPNLEELSLDSKSTLLILQSEFSTQLFSQVKVCELRFFPNKSPASLSGFLPRFSNLKELGVRDSSLKELFRFETLCGDQEDATILPRIRVVKLYNLGDLKHILVQDCQQQDPLFQYIETLELRSCANLINLAPLSASFRNLTTLLLCECNRMKNIVALSVAKSMVQLVKLSLKSCRMLMEIVGSEEDGTADEIVFSKMKTLELTDLQSLTSFCLGSCTFKFPSLQQVTVAYCPNLRIFCSGVLCTPKLQNVEVTSYNNLANKEWRWERNLNATIEQLYNEAVGFQRIWDLTLSNFPLLKEKWHAQVPFEYLRSLKKLVVECSFFSNAIPSNLLQHLCWLRVLVVEKCDSVEEVFDLEGLNADEVHFRIKESLSELHLIDLPRLRHVWNVDHIGILSFENLKLLKVHNCSNLTNIFTVSMALGVVNLQYLEVKRCSLMEQIITKVSDVEMMSDNTIFPSLQSLSLECLPNLSSFYSGCNVLKCPSLKKVEVVDCPKMELLPSRFYKEQDSNMIVEGNEEKVYDGDLDISVVAAFFGAKVAIQSLEELRVEWNNIKDKLGENSQAEYLSRLKVIELTCFAGESALLPSDFLRSLPSLKRLVLCNASVEEIILHQMSIGEEKYPQSLTWLKELKLSKLPELKHLVDEDSQPVPILQNLETLEVLECSRLEILVPSLVSFQNLVSLEVSKCHGLRNLITASAARNLVQLRRMNIKECESLQEIVGSEADGAEDDIGFNQLEYLGLHDLPCLTSFCSGNYAFNFPSLEKVMIRECYSMKIFAEQALSTPKLVRVQTGEKPYEWEWEGSLNSTIQAYYSWKW